MTRLAELGRIVAEQQDKERAGAPRDSGAAQLFVREVRRSRQASGHRRSAAVAILAVAACVVGVWGWRHHVATATDTAALAVGRPLVAQSGESLPLSFPDGSRVVLASGTEGIVHELHDAGATLEVTRGQASVAVRHQPGTSWVVGAGPYRVRVTGTRFSVGWAPERQRFELRLTEGSVVVTSEAGSHAAVTMVAPQSLVVDQGGWQLSRSETASTLEVPDRDVVPAAEPSVAVPPSEQASASPPSGSASRAAAGPSWEELARRGKYGAAYEDAARHGIAELADSKPPSSLLSLAEACRFSGHSSEAAQVLKRLRARFAGTDDAATAAFQLGRLGGSPQWFRTYLQERPNGALAREAAGRLLEVLDQANDRAGTRQAAEAYLARYPAGPHAAFARQLLGR